jgi:DNA-binding transcriptional MerR regulator
MTQKQKRPTKPTIDDAGYKLLTSTACAKLLGITAQTVRAWCDDGRLEYFRGKGNVRYISMSEVERIRKQNAFTTVDSAIQRIEALNTQRDSEIRELIAEKGAVTQRNMEIVYKNLSTKLDTIIKRQSGATDPKRDSANITAAADKGLTKVTKALIKPALLEFREEIRSIREEVVLLRCAYIGEDPALRVVTEDERTTMIGELN